ncbi:MAG: c-type cytochrome biogenesis protein CcmI [Ideonella sp.]
MGVFLFAAMTLIAFTLLCLLRPWQQRHLDDTASAREINAGVHRDQLAELDRDLAAGTIAAADHAVARDELARRLLDDTSASEAAPAATARGRQTLVAIAVALPLGATALYAMLGQPAAMLAQPAVPLAAHQGGDTEVERMVGALAARLAKNPADPQGWAMLARSYHAMGRQADAAAAFARIGADLDKDPALLAIYADALASSAQGDLEGRPTELIAAALRLDPAQPMALSLAATAAFKRGDLTEAALRWKQLLKLLPPDSDDARWVVKMLAEIGAPAGDARRVAIGDDGVAAMAAASPAAPAGTDRAVSGIVSLAPSLQASIQPDDTVFVFARPTDGSRMPLAVQRARAADLPLSFRLDDSTAMNPQVKLSAAKQVRVEVLVSRGGSANAQPGDLTGASEPTVPGTGDIALTIDRVRP